MMTPLAHSLRLAHRKVDEEVRIEQKSRAPDRLRIVRLKKRRLAMKDRLHRLALLEQARA